MREMLYLMARHELADFDRWNRLFRSHAEAQRKGVAYHWGLDKQHASGQVD